MQKNILIIQGHPDRAGQHLCHALAEAYADGARAAGHTVEILAPAQLDFPLLDSAKTWEAALPAGLQASQAALQRASHIVLVYPLWLGGMPALLKGFLEQVARPGFAIDKASRNPMAAGLLRGRSARIIVTMGMPAFVYRWFYGAHGLKMLRRNILGFVGIAPVRDTIVGGAGKVPPVQAERWLARMRKLGAAAR